MTLYFIQAGEDGPVKIGWTKASVEKRMAALQISNHAKLHLLRTVEGHRMLEGAAQRQFARFHLQGEWYAFHPAMLTAEITIVSNSTSAGMTGSELRAAIHALGMRQSQFAKMIERREGTVSDWCNDKWPVPREVELLLGKMALERINAP